MNTPYYISGREKTNPPSRVSSSRYQFLALKDAEPNLGVPLTNALPASATFLLTTNLAGDRTWLTSLLYDSTYTTFRGTSGNFVSVFNTVQGNSGRWTSAYTTLNTNSGTWLTVTSANSLYFKVSGGEIDGNVRVNGDMIVIGVLSALGGIDVIDTKVIETSSLRLVNIGAGPALYVEQAGLDNIAEFYDTEGGAALIVGNIAPVGLHNGVIGVCTTTPNETLTVKGTFSASGDVYTFGRIISAGVLLDEIILNAIPATLQSVYATVSANSGSWTSVYNSWNTTSANYTTKQFLSTNFISLCSIDVLGNVNIFGNLVATGSAFFTNTIISTTSALSVINTEQGPALFVSQGKGSGNIAEFYDSDYGDVVFTVGNAVDLNGNVRGGVIGIKTSNPDKTLTVQGEISASGYINSLQLTYVNTNVMLGRDLNTINIGGIQNTIVGEQAAQTIDLGVNNTIIGYQASKDLTDGIENVIIGSGAGQSVSLGNRNTIIGTRAAQQLASGNSNIVIGQQAAPQLLGTNNIVIGQDAGSNITNGNFNILIGTNASATMDTSRAVVIGNNAYATEEFQFVAGSEEFPFINGRFFGDLSYYGKLSGNETSAGTLTAVGQASFLSTIVVGILSGNTGAPLTIRTNNIANTERGINLDQFGDSTFAAILQLKKARGTVHTPTQLLSQDAIGNLSYWGWGTNAGFQNVASVRAVATQNFSGTTLGTELQLSNTRKNASSNTNQINLRLGDDGNVHVTNSLSAVSLSAINGTITLIDNGVKTFEADEFYIKVPAGTTAQRPGAPVNGYVRYNTTINTFEFYSNNAWRTPFLTQNVDVSTNVVATPNSTLWVDTTSGPITVTLPASPVQGDTIRIFDVAKTFDTNNLTVARNGNLIQGDADNLTVATEGAAFDLIFYSVARGWRIFSI